MFLLRDGIRFQPIKRTNPVQVNAFLTYHQDNYPQHCWSIEVAS